MQETILIVEDDKVVRTIIARWLEAGGYRVVACESAAVGLDRLAQLLPTAVCLDLTLPDGDGLLLLAQIRRMHPHTPVLVLTGDTSAATAVRALQGGAADYLTKPIERVRLLTSLADAIQASQLHRKVAAATDGSGVVRVPGLVGESPAIRALIERIVLIAASRVDVLIEGETGTGKEVVARGIHALGAEPDAPFVAINCAALSETLTESELFGHERDAFTGANRRHLGRLEQANGGTLFLDEIGELTLAAQAKLLRVLQERRFYRVGGTEEVGVAFRLIAATNRSLERMVEEGRFRQDLLFRIAVLEIQVPPLRERLDDIALIAADYLEKHCADRVGGRLLDPATLRALMERPWLGNVRELQNVLQRAMVLTPQGGPLHIPRSSPTGPRAAPAAQQTPSVEAPRSLAELERAAIEQALLRCEGDLLAASRALGIGRSTLYRKLAAYGLPLPSERPGSRH